MICFVVVMQSFIMNSHEVFIHIHQGCFAGTGAIVRLPQCQWSKPDGYGKINQCITTTKHSKAKTVCIFLGYTVYGGKIKKEKIIADKNLVRVPLTRKTTRNTIIIWPQKRIFTKHYWCVCMIYKIYFSYSTQWMICHDDTMINQARCWYVIRL